jgi:hypothetical protein
METERSLPCLNEADTTPILNYINPKLTLFLKRLL